MAFEKTVPSWNAVGTEPPSDLINNGFTAGYKPPAEYFNWFFNRMSEAAKELQQQTLHLSGGTVTGTLVLSKVQDADGDAYNSPALVVGGEPNTYHLELDNNEVQAKQNETTAGNLFLNSNGGVVHVGMDGMVASGPVMPHEALVDNFGSAAMPWNTLSARYLHLYGAADTLYGRFRVSTTGTANTDGLTLLELGNATASGTANNASAKVTMYTTGTGFTNLMPKQTATGSNTVYLPATTGTLATTADVETLIANAGGAKVAYGTYSGNGNASKTITFNGKPVYVSVMRKWTSGNYSIPNMFRPSTVAYKDGATNSNSQVTLVWGDTTLKMTQYDSNMNYNFNASGETYCYFAILE